VPNDVLIKENPELAAKYQEKCVAEQRSFDVAWELLMHDTFKLLRDNICGSQAGEMKRFRQLLVQTVLATDFFDPELSAKRKLRWEKAFGERENEQKRMSFVNFRVMDARNESNRKATIVLEYIIQASDIAHTMQHWHIFRKWNEKLFQEKYKAFKKGRTDKDPSETWFREELQFFDNYVIPLAMKLKECGVFGASSDEYLNYAQQNRAEWEAKGKNLVEHTYKDIAAAS
jgi:hypothetical protein